MLNRTFPHRLWAVQPFLSSLSLCRSYQTRRTLSPEEIKLNPHLNRRLGGGHHKKPGKGGYRGTLKGHGRDTKEVQISKNLSWLLHHGAKSAGLSMDADGYVRVQDLTNHPILRGVDFFMLQKVVKENGKQRFCLCLRPNVHRINLSGSPQVDSWWIKLNKHDSTPDTEPKLKRIFSASEIQMAVHGKSSQA